MNHATIRRSMIPSELKGRVAAKKSLIRKANARKRLLFAGEHVDWTKEQWSRCVIHGQK